MAGGWELFRSGHGATLPRQIEDSPLELYRSQEHQARPGVLERGIAMFGQQQYWLPQRMAQQQWKKDEDGNWRHWASSAETYMQAALTAPMSPPRGGSTTRIPMVRDVRRVDSFEQHALDIMQRGITRLARKPEDEPHYVASRNMMPPQLLPSDLHALSMYEEGAVDAADRSKGASIRRCIHELRAADAAVWERIFGK